MRTSIASRRGRRLAAAVVVALSAGCSDYSPAAPALYRGTPDRCPTLGVPAGSRLDLHAYARGVQIYRWNGTSWAFVEPSAVLFADAEGNSAVGTHFAGPTWRSTSGSTVVGAVIERCTPDASAIPWLLLGATATEGPGVFERTAFIQRVNTVGGLAPAAPGSAVGETASVPYTAEYLFYRAE